LASFIIKRAKDENVKNQGELKLIQGTKERGYESKDINRRGRREMKKLQE
jgi:hypothetical protein